MPLLRRGSVAAALLVALAPSAAAAEEPHQVPLPEVRVRTETTTSGGGLTRENIVITLPDGREARGVLHSWRTDDGSYALVPRSASNGGPGVAPWSRIISTIDWSYTAIVTNGGYWDRTGTANGPWLEEGQLARIHSRSGPDVLPHTRGTAIIGSEGELTFGRWTFEAWLESPNVRIPLTLEGPPPAGGIALVTDTRDVPAELHLHPLPDLRIGTTPVHGEQGPERSSVAALAALEDATLQRALAEDQLSIHVAAIRAGHPDSLPQAYDGHALGSIPGGPLILQGGVPTAAVGPEARSAQETEALSRSHRLGRHPRTVLARTETHTMILVVDGRQAGWSAGVTLAELTSALLRIGAVDALNLDGGGSSRVTGPEGDLNRPSETERYVANILTVERRQHTVDPTSRQEAHWGRPEDLVTWCGAEDDRYPAAYREGTWHTRYGALPLHTSIHADLSDPKPLCIQTDEGAVKLIWDQGVIHPAEGGGPGWSLEAIAAEGWEPAAHRPEGAENEVVAARRGRIVRWMDETGRIRIAVTAAEGERPVRGPRSLPGTTP